MVKQLSYTVNRHLRITNPKAMRSFMMNIIKYKDEDHW
jgi:hypothetical protein